MRTLSFILAFAFVLAPSVAGLSDSLPGIGTFAQTALPLSLRLRLSWLLPTNSQTESRKLPVRPSCFSYLCRSHCRGL
jgi:hypothetical protein